MPFFSGQSSTRRVDLRGKSRTEETREQTLERTRKEREARRVTRLNQDSAKKIQATWRGRRAVGAQRGSVQAAWEGRFGEAGCRASLDDLGDETFLRSLLFWQKGDNVGGQALAKACQLLLLQASSAGSGLEQPQQTSQQHACQLLRRKRLLVASLSTLTNRRYKLEWSQQLHAPANIVNAAEMQRNPQSQPVQFLAAALLHFTGPVSAASASRPASSATPLILHLAHSGLIADLQKLTASRPHQNSRSHDVGSSHRAGSAAMDIDSFLQASNSDGHPSASEMHRAIDAAHASCRQPQSTSNGGEHNTSNGSQAGATASETSASQGGPSLCKQLAQGLMQSYLVACQQQSVAQRGTCVRDLLHILCQPFLHQREPMWRVLEAAMCALCVQELAGRSHAELAGMLPAEHEWGRAGAAICLLSNLLEVGGPTLQGLRQQGTPMRAFVSTLQTLLSIAPCSCIFQHQSLENDDSEEGEEEEEEEEAADTPSAPEAGMQSPACPSTPVQAENLTWGSKQPDHRAIREFHAAADRALPATLKPLITALLPFSIIFDPAHVDRPQLVDTGQCPVSPPDVLALCHFILALIQVPGLRQKTLISLALGADFVPRLWASYLKDAWQRFQVGDPAYQELKRDSLDPGWMLPLRLLSEVYTTHMATSGQLEMYESQKPLPLLELYNPLKPRQGLVSLLKHALFQVIWLDSTPSNRVSNAGDGPRTALAARNQQRDTAGKLLSQLYDRNSRQAFAPQHAFLDPRVPTDQITAQLQSELSSRLRKPAIGQSRVWMLLRHAPFLIPFETRARLLQLFISKDKMDYDRYMGRTFILIRRDHMVEDGFARLGNLSEELKARVQIRFIDEHGLEEAGIDGGGLFKDFMENLIKQAFDPSAGLFNATSDNRLYPNPAAQLGNIDAMPMMDFLGSMLGKCVYEGILIDVPLAGFFLKKFRTTLCDVNDLPTLDGELYRNLMLLRDWDGDVTEDFSRSFTITDDLGGRTREVELVPGGSDIPVTNANRMEFIRLVSSYRLNTQLRVAAEAFKRGFSHLIHPAWVTMFNGEELQKLISGGADLGLDLADLRRHIVYASGYADDHPVIQIFWQVMEQLTDEEQSQWLKFVTACSRAPLLGFRYLEPPLCIQLAGHVGNAESLERLPTSATCMNLLKLPPYSSPHLMLQKLRLAISNVSGFDLS
ncbi:hypothetical protein WJX74_008357 [Apatococcus lobatus]|uniref:HECT-type E3 ubiquitin transferase n=1 Tax=Apatococcus lobatus TaxID=904363 RepID=A0AAW1QIR4_9CHLO